MGISRKSRELKESAIAECREILNEKKQDSFWNNRMTHAERKVLLVAAGIRAVNYACKSRYEDFTALEQGRIGRAAENAREWAAGLEVAL